MEYGPSGGTSCGVEYPWWKCPEIANKMTLTVSCRSAGPSCSRYVDIMAWMNMRATRVWKEFLLCEGLEKLISEG